MPPNSSFDVSTGVDLQEVDNAVNQALKEIRTRYDFKSTNCTIELDRKEGAIRFEADDKFRLEAVRQVLREKLARRSVPLKNLDDGQIEISSMARAAAHRAQARDRPGDGQEDLQGGPRPEVQEGASADPWGRVAGDQLF